MKPVLEVYDPRVSSERQQRAGGAVRLTYVATYVACDVRQGSAGSSPGVWRGPLARCVRQRAHVYGNNPPRRRCGMASRVAAMTVIRGAWIRVRQQACRVRQSSPAASQPHLHRNVVMVSLAAWAGVRHRILCVRKSFHEALRQCITRVMDWCTVADLSCAAVLAVGIAALHRGWLTVLASVRCGMVWCYGSNLVRQSSSARGIAQPARLPTRNSMVVAWTGCMTASCVVAFCAATGLYIRSSKPTCSQQQPATKTAANGLADLVTGVCQFDWCPRYGLPTRDEGLQSGGMGYHCRTSHETR